MKKKMISLLLVLALVVGICPTAFAAPAQSQRERADELISLAARAAKAGNLELAQEYERELQSLGVKVMTSEEVMQFGNEMTGGQTPAQTNGVVAPENTSAVHWYQYKPLENYRYEDKAYDIIQIVASSWDDTCEWLHMDKAAMKNSQKKSIPASITAQIIHAIAETASATKWTVTLGDFFSTLGEDIADFNTVDVGANDFTVYYSADYTVNFYWLSEHGADNYFLKAKDQKMEMNYSYAGLVKLTHKDGHVDSKTVAETGNRLLVYKSPTYGNPNKACKAYQDETIAEDRIGNINLTILGTKHTIITRGLPPYMESLA